MIELRGEPFISYAQNAEDVVLARALEPDDHTGFYVDVGAGHPRLESVTKAFSERGWCGINIEPLAEHHELLTADRPRDVNLNVAVGAVAGVTKLFVGPPENLGSSTTVADLAEGYRVNGQHFVAREVRLRTLAQIADEHLSGAVDFLKIDVEGMEREVIEGADWEWFRPRVVVVEATVPNTREPSHQAWESLLLNNGYEFALFDGLNRFYVRNDEPEVRARIAAPANVLDNYVPFVWLEQVETVRQMAESLDEALTATREQVAVLSRRARSLASHVASHEMTVMDLRDSLTAAQFQTAHAMAAREQLIRDAADLKRELEALEATRTFRYTAHLRARYARVRAVLRKCGL